MPTSWESQNETQHIHDACWLAFLLLAVVVASKFSFLVWKTTIIATSLRNHDFFVPFYCLPTRKSPETQ